MQELAEASGELIGKYFERPGLAVERKADRSVVTRADREAECLMREMIRARFPAHGILGEEYGEDNPGAEFKWILDPIDGTISFVHGCPLFGTLIGLLKGGKPIAGAIHLPALGHLCLGDGFRTTLDGREVRVRGTVRIEDATVLYTDERLIEQHKGSAGLRRLMGRAGVIRGWGDCYGYFLLAAGLADVMMDAVMMPWDVLPLVPVVRGAGGLITAWDGSDVLAGNSAVAAPPGLHGEVIQVLNSR
ncbi:MAG TPA: inositol monophosphatase family protein [Verrucomicrobiae bacterium]|nr:inositol monophosphatase family protein [Verrucomicrobiae bacterium]